MLRIYQKLNKNMNSFQASIDFWQASERFHASDSLNFSNFWIIETHEEEYVS